MNLMFFFPCIRKDTRQVSDEHGAHRKHDWPLEGVGQGSWEMWAADHSMLHTKASM
jgi:hypothetical protein